MSDEMIQETTYRVVQEKLISAIQEIRSAKTEFLKCSTSADTEGPEFIQLSMTAAVNSIKGAYYAISCLESSEAGQL